MLTRLKVSGFKNLINVDVRFGPFTCVAGVNGVGKSNLFDAIAFLHLLADRPLMDAALSVRSEGGRATDVRSLFHRVGDTYSKSISLSADMIVPGDARDDLGQQAKASITFLRYHIELAYQGDTSEMPGGLELVKEELFHVNLRDARREMAFPHAPRWRESAIRGRRGSPFISTDVDADGNSIIKLHQEGKQGRARPLLATNLPRTIVSATNAAESPTVVAARQEMRSWKLLQLEPSSLRRPDEFTSPTVLGADGSHLPATLYRLAHATDKGAASPNGQREAQVYAQLANRLAELIDDVRQVQVERDPTRELLTLQVGSGDRTLHPARALSDGTLRFLALAAIELDPETEGLLCLEEPENGIHPTRIPAILRLLQDIAVDTDEPVGRDNPLRQVIINTHSPAVVSQVPDDSLLVATLIECLDDGRRYRTAQFSALPDTWRTDSDSGQQVISRGDLLAYLNPLASAEVGEEKMRPNRQVAHRIIDRPDLQMLLPGIADSA